MKHCSLLIIVIALVCFGGPGHAQQAPVSGLSLSAMFSSHMVLQRGIQIPVWGHGVPGTPVSVRFNNATVRAVVQADGRWRLVLPVQQAGGPYMLRLLSGPDSLTLQDILIGDVWVCSGQSNMEMPVGDWGKVKNYQEEIAAAHYPQIRLIRLRKSASNTPEEEPGLYDREQWQACSPATVGRFSAAAYFFARDVFEKHPVPIGLVQATYGGTVAEAWVSAASLKTMPAFTGAVNEIGRKSQNQVMAAYRDSLQRWIQVTDPLDSGYQGGKAFWSANETDTSAWKTMALPNYFDDAGLPEFTGVVWFKKQVKVPASMLHKPLSITIGSTGDEQVTFFNGVEIGSSREAGKQVLTVPASLVTDSKNVLTIRLLVYRPYANIYGEGSRFSVAAGKDTLPLAGNWKYHIGYHDDQFRPPGAPDEPNRATVLFNAMIHPLITFGIRGVLWYQGEYNVGRAIQYQTLFPLLINDWRKQWHQGNFPFYFVQLANYKAVDSVPAAKSEWAELREAQTRALRLPNTAMATAIDLGEAEDIHPKNKQDVGKRLALLVLDKLYGDRVISSGPVYRGYKPVSKGSLSIYFDHTGTGLQTRDGKAVLGFSVAGKDGVFHAATAVLSGGSVMLSSALVPQIQELRYAWADNPVCNVYNSAGLPMVPFRVPIK